MPSRLLNRLSPIPPPHPVRERPAGAPVVRERPAGAPVVRERPAGAPVVRERPNPSVTAQRSEEALALDRAAWSAIQTGLAREGFDPGAPDGVAGPATRAAIRSWQMARGRSATGYLNAASMQELREASTVAADVDGCSRSMGLLGRRTHTRRGTLDGSCELYYGFTLDEAAEVTMEMTSPDVDSWLTLRRGSSPDSVELLAVDDDGGTGVDAHRR